MPAPLQDVHGHQRCVGKLQEEDLLAGNGLDASGIRTAGEDVKAVQTDAEGRMVRGLDHAPGVVVRVDMAPPGKCLVGDADLVLCGQVCELVQLVGGERVVVHRLGRNIGAHQHGVGAEAAHDAELVLGTTQVVCEGVGGQSFHVTHRLIEVDAQPEIGGAVLDLLGPERTGQQIVLEDFDAVESGAGHGIELLGQCAADRDGGDGRTHGDPLPDFRCGDPGPGRVPRCRRASARSRVRGR